MGHGTYHIIEAYQNIYRDVMDIGVHNNITLFSSGGEITYKGVVFRPVHVEHSTPGAYAYLIETRDNVRDIVFTGDFRMHGPMKHYTEEFIREAAKISPYCMLCEGTRMTPDFEKEYTEDEVYRKVNEVVEDAKGIVFGNFAMMNIDRFRSFYKAASENGRHLVVDTKMAYILKQLREKIPDLPNPCDDECLKVYQAG